MRSLDVVKVGAATYIVDKDSSYRSGDWITNGDYVWQHLLNSDTIIEPGPNYKVIGMAQITPVPPQETQKLLPWKRKRFTTRRM